MLYPLYFSFKERKNSKEYILIVLKEEMEENCIYFNKNQGCLLQQPNAELKFC